MIFFESGRCKFCAILSITSAGDADSPLGMSWSKCLVALVGAKPARSSLGERLRSDGDPPSCGGDVGGAPLCPTPVVVGRLPPPPPSRCVWIWFSNVCNSAFLASFPPPISAAAR